MTKVHSSLSDEQIAKIKKTGIPVYRFIKLGVDAKLNEMRVEEMLDNKFVEFENRQKLVIKSMRDELQDDLIEAVKVMKKIVSEQVEKDSELKEKFNLAFKTILQKLN